MLNVSHPSPHLTPLHSTLISKLVPMVRHNHAVAAPLRSLLTVMRPVLEHSHQSKLWHLSSTSGGEKIQTRPRLPEPPRLLSSSEAHFLTGSGLMVEGLLGTELAEQHNWGLNRACVVEIGMLLHDDIRTVAQLAMWSTMDATIACLSNLLFAIECAPEDATSEAAIDPIIKLLIGTRDSFSGQRAFSFLWGIPTTARDVRLNRGLIDLVTHPRVGGSWRKLLVVGLVAMLTLNGGKSGPQKIAEWRAGHREVARSVVAWADSCIMDTNLAAGTVAILEKVITVFGSGREVSGSGGSQSCSR